MSTGEFSILMDHYAERRLSMFIDKDLITLEEVRSLLRDAERRQGAASSLNRDVNDAGEA